MATDSIPQKRCTVCGETFPVTTEWFYKLKKGKYGLHPSCKKCHSIKYGHKPKVDLHLPYGVKRCTKCGQDYPATIENFSREPKGTYGLRSICKICVREYNHQRSQDPELRKQKNTANRQRREDPECRAKERDASRQRREDPEYRAKEREYQRVYRAKPDVRQRLYINTNNRCARKRNLDNDFTLKEWQTCLAYWNNKCCYCGCEGAKKNPITIDHFIPVIKNGATTRLNMLPACKSCNCSKNKTDVTLWLTRKYGATRAAEILAQIAKYFEWVAQKA